MPAQVLHKAKRGFMIPIGDWIKEDLKDYIFELLNADSINSRGIFNYSYVQELLDSHFKGRGVFTHQIYALLVFELWCEKYL